MYGLWVIRPNDRKIISIFLLRPTGAHKETLKGEQTLLWKPIKALCVYMALLLD